MIEKVQRRTLRLIYGYEKKYDELLTESGLQTLEQRRIEALTKFAHKTVKNPKYASWVPLRHLQRLNRQTKPYLEETATGNRLYKSPIFTMRRILNGDHLNEDLGLPELFEL